MQAVVIKPDGTQEKVQLEKPLYKAIGNQVGGFIEIVRPRTGILEEGLCMIVNEDGLHMDLELNPIATVVYGFGPVVGNVVILREVMGLEGLEFAGLTDLEVQRLKKTFVVQVIEQL